MKIIANDPVGMERLDGLAKRQIQTSTFGSRMSAILRTESDIAMMADKINYYTDHGEPEEGYNPYTSGLIPQDMLEEFPEEFAEDHNRNQTELTVGRFMHLKQQRKIREEANVAEALLGYGVGGLATSTTIPFMLMPAGALFKGGAATKGALNVGKTAAEVAALGAIEESLAEYWRRDFDPYRTDEESAAAIASVALFGGVLGALGGKMSNTAMKRAAQDMEAMKRAQAAGKEEGGLTKWLDKDGNLSAAKVKEIEEAAPESIGWIGSKWLGGGMFPGMRLFTSPAKKVRLTADKLITNTFGSKRSSAENNIRRTELVARTRLRVISNEAYKKARADGYVGKDAEFFEEIGRAAISKDKHENPHVAAAAQAIREEIFDPIARRFQQFGDLPEELETKFADSYLPRLYKEDIAKNSHEYEQRLKNFLLEKDAELTDAEALDLAHDYMKKIQNWDVSKLPVDVVGSTGRLKARGIELRDSDLQDLGFLDKNVIRVTDKYINSVVPEMEIKQSFGAVERGAELKRLQEDYEAETVRLKSEFEERMKDPKVLREMTKEEIRTDFEDYMYFAEEKYKGEQEAIREIYKGRMEDADIEIERISKEVSKRYNPQRAEIYDKYEKAQTTRRNVRDKQIAKEQAEFDDVESIVRKDFENSKPKNELERVKGQKAMEQKIRAARKIRDEKIAKLKNASTREAKQISKEYDTAKQKIEDSFEKEMQPHREAYDESVNQARIKRGAAERETRTAYENDKDILRKQRDKELRAAQKEKKGGEAALRREARSSLRIQKDLLKKKKKELGGGTHLLKKELDEIDAEYDDLIKKTDNQKEINKLNRRRELDKNDINAMRDKLLGIYKRPSDDIKNISNIGKFLRTWAYMAYMGMITIASIPDMARTIMKNGVVASWKGFRGGFPAFIKGLDAQSAVQREALNHMGIAVDATLSSRALMMGDISDVTGWQSVATKVFTKYTLMNRWNDALKHVAGVAGQHRFLTEIQGYDSLSKARKIELAERGFDQKMVDRIRSEAGSFTTVKGARIANTMDWVDKEAAEHFEKMLLKDVEIAIVTPGVGDAPLFMSGEFAKLAFQFKTFFFASHVRAFLPMLKQMSRGDANAFIGAMIQVALGAFVVEPTRMLLSGRIDEMDEKDWQDLAYAGMDRSGVATLAMEAFNMSDKFAQGQIGAMMNIKNSRYHQRGIQLSGGPGLGIAEKFARMPMDIGSGMVNGELRKGTAKNINSIMPVHNLFYLNWLFKMGEDSAADAWEE